MFTGEKGDIKPDFTLLKNFSYYPGTQEVEAAWLPGSVIPKDAAFFEGFAQDVEDYTKYYTSWHLIPVRLLFIRRRFVCLSSY